MTSLFSFDIDGTLEIGDPPGPILLELLRRIRSLGHTIGSCSDRPVSHQQDIWKQLGLPVDFVALKTDLPDIRARFAAAAYYHVGDTHIDRHYAILAGFSYLVPDPATVEALL